MPDLTRLPTHRNLGSIPGSGVIPNFRSGVPKSTSRRIRSWHKKLSRLIPPRVAFQLPQATALFLPSSKTLLVRGIIIEKVARIVYDNPCWEFSATGLSQIEHWEQECLKISQTTLRCPDTIPAPHARTLIANYSFDDDPAQGQNEQWKAHVRAREILKAKSLGKTLLIPGQFTSRGWHTCVRIDDSSPPPEIGLDYAHLTASKET